MTEARLIRVDDVAPQRWRNGGGLTRELLAWPDAAAWQVRVSVADIGSDGPFSAFAGVERWFAVLDGDGVELEIDGQRHRLRRDDAPLRFAGDAQTHCRLLDGPTRDLNLMLRGVPGAMSAVTAERPWQPQAAQCGLFTAVAGQCRDNGAAIAVPAYALLWFARSPASLVFLPDAAGSGTIGWWLQAAPPEAAA